MITKTKCIFWNIHKQTNEHILSSFINEQKPDFLFVTETDKSFIEKITVSTKYSYIESKINKEKPKIFLLSKFGIDGIALIQEYKKRMFVYEIQINKFKIILIALHLGSKINMDEQTQMCEALDYINQINNIEKSNNLFNTIVIGDFNMNPFDLGMIAGNGFNSVISKEIALKEKRKYQHNDYLYFYNPSWKLFGSPDNLFGTYYLNNPPHSGFYWNIYDQVLVRPNILKHFEVDYDIIKNDKYFNVRGQTYSDHSPIYLELKRRNICQK